MWWTDDRSNSFERSLAGHCLRKRERALFISSGIGRLTFISLGDVYRYVAQELTNEKDKSYICIRNRKNEPKIEQWRRGKMSRKRRIAAVVSLGYICAYLAKASVVPRSLLTRRRDLNPFFFFTLLRWCFFFFFFLLKSLRSVNTRYICYFVLDSRCSLGTCIRHQPLGTYRWWLGRHYSDGRISCLTGPVGHHCRWTWLEPKLGPSVPMDRGTILLTLSVYRCETS